MDKSPHLAPVTGFSGDDILGNGLNPDGTPAVPVAPQLLIESDRIPKRMLQRLKQRPDLAAVDWGSETGKVAVIDFTVGLNYVTEKISNQKISNFNS
jgi:hypothetical protein